MQSENKTWYLRGLRDGLPIMLGYAAVGFTLGIAARNAGLSAFQAGLASLLNNASAGEKAGFMVIQHNEGYLAMALRAKSLTVIFENCLIAVIRNTDRILPGHIDLVHGMVTHFMKMRNISAGFL